MMKLTLYHGTNCVFRDIDLSKSFGRRDFGVGFYTTTISNIQGTYSAAEAIERLQFSRVNDQVSFHTERAVKCLNFVRRYTVD